MGGLAAGCTPLKAIADAKITAKQIPRCIIKGKTISTENIVRDIMPVLLLYQMILEKETSCFLINNE